MKNRFVPGGAKIYFKHVTEICEESAFLGLKATSRFRAKSDVDAPSHLLETYDGHGYRHEELVDEAVQRYFAARESNSNKDDRQRALVRIGASVFHFTFVTRWIELCGGIPFRGLDVDDKPGTISPATISDLTAALSVTSPVVDDLYDHLATDSELTCFRSFYSRFVEDADSSSAQRDEYLKVWQLSTKLSSHVLIGLTSGLLPGLGEFDPYFATCDPVRADAIYDPAFSAFKGPAHMRTPQSGRGNRRLTESE